jgi:hypothetical protein
MFSSNYSILFGGLSTFSAMMRARTSRPIEPIASAAVPMIWDNKQQLLMGK